MFMLLTIGLFLIFVTNVVLGAFGGPQFLTDVGEMITLFSASIAFVVVILQREAEEKRKNEET